jgi:hypothetical protein
MRPYAPTPIAALSRGSSNEEDARDPTREMAAQSRPPRSIAALVVSPCTPAVVAPVMVEHHYLHAMPKAPIVCFTVRGGGVLVGGSVFTAGARLSHKILGAAAPGAVLTLARFWLADDLPKNAESRVLSYMLRWLQRHGHWRAVVSFADPAAGHVGTIYQATGWLFVGATAAESYIELIDGALHHPRSVYTHYGTNRARHLSATGVPARRVATMPKLRYIYLLDPAWRWRLVKNAVPYPRGRGPPLL